MWKIVSAARLKEMEDTISEQKAKIEELNSKLNAISKSSFNLELENIMLKNVRKPNQRPKLRTRKDKDQ